MEIADKKVVLIGGTSGIGLATARAAAAGGAEVLVASRSRDNVDKALTALPSSAAGDTVDVTDEADVARFFERVGEFDHLVFTAGAHLYFTSIQEISTRAARDCFEIRFWGPFMAAKYGAARIRAGGSIVLTSGIVAVRPVPNTAAQSTATGAVDALTRALAVELSPVRVNAVRLGPVPTEADPFSSPNAPLYRTIADKLLTKRLGRPDEAAAAYLYLMSSGYTTGVILTLDGGFVLV
jgi:NAD(P)-dependent dehydrogenase (short-subunit alcohol dehydrogenase family)